MAEQLIQSLKDRLSHVNEDQGFDLRRNLNVAVSAYRMVPHCATGFLPFVLLYGREALHHMKSRLLGMVLKNSTKTLSVLMLRKCLNFTRGRSSTIGNTR